MVKMIMMRIMKKKMVKLFGRHGMARASSVRLVLTSGVKMG